MAAAAAPAQAAPIRAVATEEAISILGWGDSIAAGVGLGSTSPAGPFDAACGRSPQSFVAQLGAALHAPTTNLACAGATTWHGVVGNQMANGTTVPSQLLQTYQQPRARVAVGIVGANDVNWSGLIAQCVATNCATPENRAAFAANLERARVGLAISLAGLELAQPQQIVLLEYYDIFAGLPFTPAQLGFTPDEQDQYRLWRGALNSMIAEVGSHFPHVTVVPLEMPVPLQLPGTPGQLHPTAVGQTIIANAVRAVLR
ncbi:MAG TPA: GDSL-type esterase/lipase family protein [Candidatus Saccharimonadia bacterium]|nr:GDSL-type esterase/lipase family protein [Candidatus Saccharimonadia bacterium]